MFADLLCWLVALVGLAMVAGTLISFSDHPHWFVRGWDFPRMQILSVCAATLLLYALCFTGQWYEWVIVASIAAALLWQAFRIFPYTPLAPRPVRHAGVNAERNPRLRLVISNVQRENTQWDRWRRVITAADPDVILAVEVDQRWERQLDSLREHWPAVIRQPQDNCYGMMLLSRFELADSQVRFLVQEDIPSIVTRLQLPSGEWLRLYGVHPRPPEPRRDQNATPRNAELVLIGQEIDHPTEPTIVAGDLNDVAWSKTTRLFQRLSGLLDPRRGRGFYNTFNANNPLLRFPLDHVFHSDDFQLIELRRLEHVGSDHFPVLIELSYLPQKADEQTAPEEAAGDQAEAQERVEDQTDAEQAGEEDGKLSR